MTDYISEMQPGLDRAILRILSFHVGIENAIARIMLRGDCNRHGFRVDDRTLRAAINHLRKDGNPICSMGGDNGGYYLATSRQELDDYIEREISYGLFRPWAPSPFMQYETAREAIYIAKYIERFGGSFASDIRKAAKRSWTSVGQFKDDE